MGLSCSPAQLNLILSNIFCDKSRFHSLACYVDDILIFSQDWKAHLQQLELALKTLHDNHISCSPTKTEIGYQEVEYLGHRLSVDSIRISEKRVEAVDKIQPPKNVKGLQRVLGMFNYWKKYLPDYSKNTYNMRQLLKKDTDFKWTAECQKELDYLKKCLASDPILKPIDLNRDLIISCDASIYGIGFVIMQADDDGMLHAVRYGSYATTPAQANYSAEDLEAVALMYSLKSIEWLALCRHVTVLTDNTAVLHIQDWNPRNRQQRRMLTYIMQFDLTICYIRGSSNTTPDTLSRLFQDSSPQERRKNEPTYMHEIDDFILPITTRSHGRTSLPTHTADTDARTVDGLNMTDPTDNTVLPDTMEIGGGSMTLPPAPVLVDTSNPPATVAADRTTVNSDTPLHPDGTETSSHSPTVFDTDNTMAHKAPFPLVSAKNYTDDAEFSGMYQYLLDGTLSGNAKKDKLILLMEDKYNIDEDDLLYHVDTPRQKNLAQLKPTTKRLCVPLKFRHDMISYVYNNCGHYAAQSLFHTLAAQYFWKSMFADGVEYCRTCDTCQRTKLNYGHRYAPLHPLSVPDELGTRFSMDHKVLTRTTSAGNTAILVIVECFSGFPHLIPVPDQTEDTTARAIIKHIVPFWGIHFSLYSDKAPSFMSALFAHVNAMLGIRHVTSASRTARSNGQAEALVKHLSEHLKFYAKDDYSIEEVIPIIEVNLRATPHSKLLISPYAIVFGRPMRIGIPGDPRTTPPAGVQSADAQGPHVDTTAARDGSAPINAEPRAPQPGRTEPLTDPTSYYRWLSTEFRQFAFTSVHTVAIVRHRS